jgi:TadE-like protein
VRARQRGQATVELALCLPIVLLVLGALVEVGLIAADQLRLWHAAREAARVAVVDPEPAAARAAAERGGFEDVDVDIEPEMAQRRSGDPLTVRIAYDRPGAVPFIGSLFERVTLRAGATMRIERP